MDGRNFSLHSRYTEGIIRVVICTLMGSIFIFVFDCGAGSSMSFTMINAQISTVGETLFQAHTKKLDLEWMTKKLSFWEDYLLA